MPLWLQYPTDSNNSETRKVRLSSAQFQVKKKKKISRTVIKKAVKNQHLENISIFCVYPNFTGGFEGCYILILANTKQMHINKLKLDVLYNCKLIQNISMWQIFQKFKINFTPTLKIPYFKEIQNWKKTFQNSDIHIPGSVPTIGHVQDWPILPQFQ